MAVPLAPLESAALLVAITVTLGTVLRELGAVYTPCGVMLPAAGTFGSSDQSTFVVVPPVAAENVCVCDAFKVTVPGLTIRGIRETGASSHRLPSAWLQA